MIHPSAIIDPKAQIDSSATIGAHVMIGPDVVIKKDAVIQHHAMVDNVTVIEEGVNIFPYAAIGGIPQDLKYKKSQKCFCKVGARTVLREFVTLNAGAEDGHPTEVGSDCLLMAYSHMGHNAVIGNRVIMANSATLAGHVHIDDQAVIGGLVGIHQFVKIGKMVIVGGCSKVVKDLPPFMLADGNPAVIRSINKVGLHRKGYSDEKIAKIKMAFKYLYRSDLMVSTALEKIKALGPDPEIMEIINFINNSDRGITKGAK